MENKGGNDCKEGSSNMRVIVVTGKGGEEE